MLKWFVCPDGGLIETEECVKQNGCRLHNRCMSRPALQQMSRNRMWDGKPSVTQLLIGTYEAMLRVTSDYLESPDSMVFSLLGTTVHNKLDQASGDGIMTEDDIGRIESDDGVTGLPDLITDEFNETVLMDYKVAGSFKVAKALGLEFDLVESASDVYKQKTYIKDKEGNTIVREKGQPKMLKIWKQNISKQDCFEWSMQTNKYRVMVQQKKGIKIDKIVIQAFVRDGGTQASKERGVVNRSYLIPIPILPDEEIEAYFSKKRDDLISAVEQKDWHEKCSDTETWNGRKCQEYCSVRHYCKWINQSIS